MGSRAVWMAAASLTILIVGGLLFSRRRHRAVISVAPVEAPGDPVPAVERRKFPRRWGDPVQVLISDFYHGEQPLKAWVVNRSEGGLSLSSPESIIVGSIVKVRVTLASSETPWIDLEIKNCNPVAGRWVLNCMYVEQPADEVRLLFR